MTWFKVDDNLTFHPKVLAAGNTAMGMWVRAGSWSAQQLSDGLLPWSVVSRIGRRREAEALVTAGLWVPVLDGYAFHEWDHRQPSRADVEATRRAGAERLRRWRERGP